MKAAIAVISIVAIVSLVFLFSSSQTGMAFKKGRGYDWDYQAVIAYNKYAAQAAKENLCNKQIQLGHIPAGFKTPMTYRDAMDAMLNLQTDCMYAYPWTGYPGYCCKMR